MNKWVKLIKNFQGGFMEHYVYMDVSRIETEDQKKDFMSNFGENTDGGHNYGYRVSLEILDGLPPLAWFIKQQKNG